MGNKLRRLRKKEPKIPSSPTGSTQNVAHTDPQPSESGSTQSEVQPDQASESDLPIYYVWYRHMGEDLPSYDWRNLYTGYKNRSVQQILEDVGEHDITHLSIKHKLPPSLKDIAPNLTHLQIFAVGDPQLESLRELKALKELILLGNSFSNGLPHVIGELKSLTELYLEGWPLTDLPEDLGKLKKLEVLSLKENDFTDGLPTVIGELTSLTELNIEGCELKGQLDDLSELKQLKILHIGGNDFSNGLPKVLTQLPLLTKLSLDYCDLQSLPPWFGKLQQLKVLDLNGNNFSSDLPDVFAELCSLMELYLRDCSLTDLPPSMSNLNKQLKILKLGGNDFSNELPEVITELTSLTELSLMDCHLTSLPPRVVELEHLEKLDLVGNNFSDGLPEVIVDVSSLTELHLQTCSLTKLPRFGELQQLKELDLNDNNFSEEFPDLITELRSLTKLRFGKCSLTDLPPSLVNLERLRDLDLQDNKLKRIPSVIYKLKELESLDVSYNSELVEMDNGILQLNKLQKIELDGTSLQPPLGDVALQGVEIIKKYFLDLSQKAVVSTIPVAIIGEGEAGKTSIRKSLISRERESIDRSSPAENATKVFEVETLNLGTSEVNLIDFGGQDIYHVAYQLALKETCVPLLVVHMARYKELINEIGSAEQATKRLCMEWLCHLYVAHPTLGTPMLALTHIDELSSHEEFRNLKGTLLQKAEDIQSKWLKREERFSGTAKSDGNSKRISCIKKLKFIAKDIFEFTNETESSDIKALTQRIESRCVGEIPQHWKDVEDVLEKFPEPYIELSAITKNLPDYRGILQYLHNTGAILWFDQKEELKDYVFHRTQAVTDMVALLFPLDKEKMETACIESFSGCFDERKEKEIGITEYKQFLKNYLYKTAGMIDEAFLCNQVETQAKFKFSIAKDLLMCFRIIHGPIQLKDDSSPRTVYLVPSFIKKSLDKPWETPDKCKLQLRLDLIFNGLPLPEHVYQLMTVEVLNLKKEDEHVEAYSNGAEVQHEQDNVTYLVHDYYKQKVTVQVSTNTAHLKESWDHLKRATKALKSWLEEEWPACLVELETYCTHCLFLRDANPGSITNPEWYKTDETDPRLLRERKCLKPDAKDLVPTAFLVPCAAPKKRTIEKLEGYLTKWQSETCDTD